MKKAGGCSAESFYRCLEGLAFQQETLRQNLAEGFFGKSQPVLEGMTIGIPAVAGHVNGGDGVEMFRKRKGRSGSVMQQRVGWSKGRLDAGFRSSTSWGRASWVIIGWDSACNDLNATGLGKLVVPVHAHVPSDFEAVARNHARASSTD